MTLLKMSFIIIYLCRFSSCIFSEKNCWRSCAPERLPTGERCGRGIADLSTTASPQQCPATLRSMPRRQTAFFSLRSKNFFCATLEKNAYAQPPRPTHYREFIFSTRNFIVNLKSRKWIFFRAWAFQKPRPIGLFFAAFSCPYVQEDFEKKPLGERVPARSFSLFPASTRFLSSLRWPDSSTTLYRVITSGSDNEMGEKTHFAWNANRRRAFWRRLNAFFCLRGDWGVINPPARLNWLGEDKAVMDDSRSLNLSQFRECPRGLSLTPAWRLPQLRVLARHFRNLFSALLRFTEDTRGKKWKMPVLPSGNAFSQNVTKGHTITNRLVISYDQSLQVQH